MTGSRSFPVLCAAILCTIVMPTLADRKPTLEERTRIETKLRELGYSRWDEIEFDEERSVWEVDDARAGDGKDYDLKLDPQTLDITSRELDD